MKEDSDKFLPLSPAAQHTLLALASEDRHGYGIMQHVARQSDDRYKLVAGIAGNIRAFLHSEVLCRGSCPWVVDRPGALAITAVRKEESLVEAVAKSCS